MTSKISVCIPLLGYGNIKSLTSWFSRDENDFEITFDQNKAKKADLLILPGVGSFEHINLMNQAEIIKLQQIIHERQNNNLPILAICLGMHILFSTSSEAPGVKGLSVFDGSVKSFSESNNNSWNIGSKDMYISNTQTSVYFCHKYYSFPVDSSIIKLKDNFNGTVFPVLIVKNRLVGLQFHPELSNISFTRFNSLLNII